MFKTNEINAKKFRKWKKATKTQKTQTKKNKKRTNNTNNNKNNNNKKKSALMCFSSVTNESSRTSRDVTGRIWVVGFCWREKIIIQFPHTDSTNNN